MGSELERPFRRGKPLAGGHKTSREVALSGVMGMTGLPVPRVQGLDILRSVTPFWKPLLLHTLGRFSGPVGLPSRHSLFSALLLFHLLM